MPRAHVLASLALCACQSQAVVPRIEGRVVDAFGQPLAGVTVHVRKSAYTAQSDADGRYGVPYAPGAFEVSYALEGYTTEVVSLHIEVPTAFPSEQIVLYARPRKGSLYAYGAGKLQDVPASSVVEKVTFKGFRSARTWRCAPDGPVVGSVGAPITFADATDTPIRVARLGPGGLITSDDRASDGSRYEGWRESHTAFVGTEQLQVRTFTPSTAGSFAWVTIDANADTPPDGARCHAFHIDEPTTTD